MRAVKSPHLLRADEGPRRARHQARRPAGRHARRQGQGPLRHRGLPSASASRTRPTRAPWRRSPVSLDKLLQAVALGNIEGRRAHHPSPGASPAWSTHLPEDDQARITQASGGLTLKDLAPPPRRCREPGQRRSLAHSRDRAGVRGSDSSTPASRRRQTPPRSQAPRAPHRHQKEERTRPSTTSARTQVIEAGFSASRARPRQASSSFEQFIQHHKDEITALQVLYSNGPTRRAHVRGHQGTGRTPSSRHRYLWNESQLWQAYAALEKSKVKGASGKRILTDLVSLVRFAIHQDNELVPFPERVNANFKAWLAQQEASSPPSRRG